MRKIVRSLEILGAKGSEVPTSASHQSGRGNKINEVLIVNIGGIFNERQPWLRN